MQFRLDKSTRKEPKGRCLLVGWPTINSYHWLLGVNIHEKDCQCTIVNLYFVAASSDTTFLVFLSHLQLYIDMWLLVMDISKIRTVVGTTVSAHMVPLYLEIE